MTMRFWVFAVLLGTASVPALAQEDVQLDIKPVTGSYYMGPAMDSDDPNAPKDHIYMTLTGDVAKSMWDAIAGEPQPDECVGRMVKWSNSLACYGPPSPQSGGAPAPDDSAFECYMGVDLKAGALYLGNDC
jgi:hypothetical protein